MAGAATPGVIVSAVARRWQVRPQQVFARRREAACADLPLASEGVTTGSSVPAFVPFLTEAMAADPAPAAVAAPVIEIALAGVVVRVAAGADTAQLTTVLRAIRASATSARFTTPAGVRVLLATRPVDFRNYAERAAQSQHCCDVSGHSAPHKGLFVARASRPLRA